MRALLIAVVRLFRATVGSILPDSCRFTPSCSHYAVEAIARRGALAGSALTLRRLLRCHPWSAGGFDPVAPSRPPCRPPPPRPSAD